MKYSCNACYKNRSVSPQAAELRKPEFRERNPAACGGVSALTNFLAGIGDSSLLVARSFNSISFLPSVDAIFQFADGAGVGVFTCIRA